MDPSVFAEFGLTRTEITTYITMLELGTANAGTIRKETGLPNSTIHRDLNALIQKGLVNYIFEGKRKIYQATDPEHFYTYIEDKKNRFTEILPELQAKQARKSKTEKATVFKGIRGIKEIYNIMIHTEGEYNTFGGGPITADIMGMAWWLNLHKKRVENKLPSRQVFDDSVRRGGKEIGKNPLTQIRYVEKEFAQFQETVIVGDRVAIAVFTENPYAFLIEDCAVAESYRKHFELLWRSAKT